MLPYWFFRMIRRGGYGERFGTRLGIYSREERRSLSEGRNIWVHAVSVGEVYVALQILDSLRVQMPDHSFVFTTNTSTGYSIARKKLPEEDILLYFPSDLPLIMKRVVRIIDPELLILTECEIWPNLIRFVKEHGGRVAIVNGRLSDSSSKGYRKVRFFFRRVFNALDLVCVQTETDAARFMELGAQNHAVVTCGSCKYDMALKAGEQGGWLADLMAQWGILPGDITIVGGSTWPGEEAALLDAYVRLRPYIERLKLILVPRHAERRKEIEKEIAARDLAYVRRTGMNSEPPHEVDVILGDSTGEMMAFYAVASAVFVGKSLTAHGGQNFIEPASLGKPVIVGPNLENFPVLASEFKQAEAFRIVRNTTELADQLAWLMKDREARLELGQRARDLVRGRQGTVDSTVNHLLSCIGRRSAGASRCIQQ
jgi:3-deoxy-D-manno-octulosonic-acid transferase